MFVCLTNALLFYTKCWERHVPRFLLDGRSESKSILGTNTVFSFVGQVSKGSQSQHAMILFEAMSTAQLWTDVIIYSAAISACEKGGQWQQALTLFLDMPQANINPNVVSYNAAISACETGNQWHEVIHLLMESVTAVLKLLQWSNCFPMWRIFHATSISTSHGNPHISSLSTCWIARCKSGLVGSLHDVVTH